MSIRLLTFLVLGWVLWGASIQAKPEYFVEAVQYGANDCSFCHQTAAGGEAVNDRGAWLIQERDRLGEVDINISWLTKRGEVADENRELEIPASSEPLQPSSQQADSDEVIDEPVRPLDYTTDFGEWPSYNGNLKAQKFSPQTHINQKTVQNLKLAWVWEAQLDNGTLKRDDESASNSAQSTRRFGRRSRGNTTGSAFQGTPLMVDGKVFVRTRVSSVVAIHAATGEELWEFDPKTRLGPRPPMFGFTTRGLGYHRQESCEGKSSCDRVILLTSDGWLYALDTETGEPVPSFGEDGKVDLTQGLRRHLPRNLASWSHPPLVCNDVVVVGSQTDDVAQFRSPGPKWNENLPVGDVRGFDPVTGKQIWNFKTIPQEGEFGVETWGNESWRWMGNTNVWSTFSCDSELGHVYLPLTAPTDHMYGGHRPGDNLFATSVVALNVANGERVWHFQITHHDIWDYDLPAPPVVGDIVVDGKERKVLSQVTKVGYLFVLDRTDGKPIWPVEERAVPPSSIETEYASPTQPHPTKPPPYEFQGIDGTRLNALTPELKKRALEMIKDVDIGPLYTPLSERGVVLNPGIGGGANWPGATFNPETQQLFVPSRRMPQIARLQPIDPDRFGIFYRESWGFSAIEGLPFVEPPWSSITAYDLNKGDIHWTVANGRGPKDHPLLKEVSSTLPDLGEVGALPGLLALPDLLVFGHRSGQEPSVLKFIDPANGTDIWQTQIPGVYASPAPISYTYAKKQYIVIGTGMFIEPTRLVAFALDVAD